MWDQAGAHETDAGIATIYLRRVFELPAAPKGAKLHITVDNRYTLFVNGEKVGSDGEWNTVEQYDLAKQLKAGKNVIAVEAGNDGGPAGAIVWLGVTFAGVVRINNREYARLECAGSVKGVDDVGPGKHTLDGTAYFDLEAGLQ